jgi:hypothetical protein
VVKRLLGVEESSICWLLRMGSTASIYQQQTSQDDVLHEAEEEEEYEHKHQDHESKLSGSDLSSHPLPFSMTHRPPKHQSPSKSSKHPIALNVNAFLEHQVSQVSLKVADQRSQSVPRISSNKQEPTESQNTRQVFSSTPILHQHNGSTVRSHALRLHSRQKNSYINASSLKFSTNSSTFVHRDKSSDQSSVSSGGGGGGGAGGGGSGVSSGEYPSLTNDSLISPSHAIGHTNNIIGTSAYTNNTSITKKDNPIKKKFNLKLQINDDEDDWIQVDDDEAGDIMTPRVTKEALGHDQSYTLTQSGTIFVNGFGEGIGKNGLAVGSKYQTKLPMRERLVFLCQLGHGASSTVYKALDLTQLQLVGVKMIPVFDRAKRRQMVRELSALFQMLRKKERELANPSSPTAAGPHVNINFDLKGRKENGSNKQHSHQDQSPRMKGQETTPPSGYKLYSQQYIVDFYDAFRCATHSLDLSLTVSLSLSYSLLLSLLLSLSLSLSLPLSLSLSLCPLVTLRKAVSLS